MKLSGKTLFAIGGKNALHLPSKLTTAAFLLVIITCDLPSLVYPVPLPSSSAWSLPTLNYLFKDTKTRSQSTRFQNEHENGESPVVAPSSSLSAHKHSPPRPSIVKPTLENNEGKPVSTTGRLISAHDIRLTDNWGWVRRTPEPAPVPEKRKHNRTNNNIRHSKSKHKQRHSSSTSSSISPISGIRSKKKEPMENLLCPFDEIRGPDGKCRKAPRFSLYRVGRK